MTKCDINGNVTARNTNYLKRVIRNMNSGTYSIDWYGRMMVDCPDGGTIVFFYADEPHIARRVTQIMHEVEKHPLH